MLLSVSGYFPNDGRTKQFKLTTRNVSRLLGKHPPPCSDCSPLPGNRNAALSLETLQSHGITHVVNMAMGQGLYRVDTDASFYEESQIIFLGIQAEDASFYDIASHFTETSKFIASALYGEGKVLVHCREGYSRAPTIVCAFLMMKRKMDLLSALKLINQRRKICPNMGFMEQLIELNAVELTALE